VAQYAGVDHLVDLAAAVARTYSSDIDRRFPALTRSIT
jgi:hypothetical protein